MQTRQGLMIGCPEEIAYRRGFIDADAVAALGQKLGKTEHGRYLIELAREKS